MKVLFNHYSSVPNKITGISVYSWSILEALVGLGQHEYVLSTNWDIDRLPEQIRSLDIKKVHINNYRNESSATIYNTYKIRKICKEQRCDAIFNPQPVSMFAPPLPQVTVIHDLYRLSHPNLYSAAARWQWRYVTSSAFLQSAAIICVSNHTASEFGRFYGSYRGVIEVVHEASSIKVSPKYNPEAIREEKYGLFVANITPNKNIKLLADAINILIDRGVNYEFVIVGRGEAPEIEACIERGARIRRLKDLPEERLSALYAGATVFINTSIIEGFCLPIVEAHLHGLPVICTDLPVLREVAGDGAYFVGVNSSDLLADAITQVFENPEYRERLRERAVLNAKRFSWEKAAISTQSVIARAIS